MTLWPADLGELFWKDRAQQGRAACKEVSQTEYCMDEALVKSGLVTSEDLQSPQARRLPKPRAQAEKSQDMGEGASVPLHGSSRNHPICSSLCYWPLDFLEGSGVDSEKELYSPILI